MTSAISTANAPTASTSAALTLIPVTLKEAALDSPTYRATLAHFAEQTDGLERWLESYLRAATKLVADLTALENTVNTLLGASLPPVGVGEAVLDHDYTLLALRRYGDGAREYWGSAFRGGRKYETNVVDSIRTWMSTELRTFKELRKSVESSQRAFDTVLAKYLSQVKSKEASSLREDAFLLHDTRRTYLKASLDFCTAAPQLRVSLDKMLVSIFTEQWKEMRSSRNASAHYVEKHNGEMERVRGWCKEMEGSERAFKRELATARKQIEESSASMTRPSRELEDYAASTVPYLGNAAGMASPPTSTSEKARNEKQGWLFQRTLTSHKPTRTIWVRRWFFVKAGIFGWLLPNPRSGGGVEESEKTGVLLCSVRPAFLEERRFCFEVKTKDTNVILQAETQQELTDWIAAFEVAKRKALEDPASTQASSSLTTAGVDPAFAVTQPIAPEFAAKTNELHASDDAGFAPLEQTPTRASFDVNGSSSTSRRIMSMSTDNVSGDTMSRAEHGASRIIQKFDLHKRSTPSGQVAPSSTGGIASLISASHNVLPVGPGAPPTPQSQQQSSSGGEMTPRQRGFTLLTAGQQSTVSSLAPSTLANLPATTGLSHAAVVVSGERGLGDSGVQVPMGIMANVWGGRNWGDHVNWLGGEQVQSPLEDEKLPKVIAGPGTTQDDVGVMDGMNEPLKDMSAHPPVPLATDLLQQRHRKTLSSASEAALPLPSTQLTTDDYPTNYPLPLKAQQAQFRLLFPSLPRTEKVVLVFRAVWSPNDGQEFPGTVYVTLNGIYFYSNYLGLVLVTAISLKVLSEITAARGRECDFLYLHLSKEGEVEDEQKLDGKRVTIKVFLEPMRLLQRRLDFLASNAREGSGRGLEEVLRVLIKMESSKPQRSSSVESWEDGGGLDSPEPRETVAGAGESTGSPLQRRLNERGARGMVRVDGSLYGDGLGTTARTGREVQKFRLPAQAVVYAPADLQAVVQREYTCSAKALFHVLFGDKSAVFQRLYGASADTSTLVQIAWTKDAEGRWVREFTYQGELKMLPNTQRIDVANEHLCYAASSTSFQAGVPYATGLQAVTKIVITHAAKSRCRLALYPQVIFKTGAAPRVAYIRRLVEARAMANLNKEASALVAIADEQVGRLGGFSKTNRAQEIFGGIGGQGAGVSVETTRNTNPSACIRLAGRGVLGLIADDIMLKFLYGLSLIGEILVATGKGIADLWSAHALLIGLLTLSAAWNSWYSARDGVTWYHDRAASGFMHRVGVRPDAVVGRAVYLRDIEGLIETPTFDFKHSDVNTTGVDVARTCGSTFAQQLTSSPSLAGTGRKSAGARLHRTRDGLARYRYDLLVALRVVDRVEKDVVEAEWEAWVRSEGRRCEEVKSLLAQKKEGQKADVENELGEEFRRYCESCREGQKREGVAS